MLFSKNETLMKMSEESRIKRSNKIGGDYEDNELYNCDWCGNLIWTKEKYTTEVDCIICKKCGRIEKYKRYITTRIYVR